MLGTCSGQDHAATGTVTGTLVRVGGPIQLLDGVPAAPTAVPLPGRVVAESTDGSRYTASVDRSGHYTISLPPGTYQLTGYSPLVRGFGAEVQCRSAHAVQVTAGTTTTGIDVICSVR
jgi:polysaccharide lyase family 4-like protein